MLSWTGHVRDLQSYLIVRWKLLGLGGTVIEGVLPGLLVGVGLQLVLICCSRSQAPQRK